MEQTPFLVVRNGPSIPRLPVQQSLQRNGERKGGSDSTGEGEGGPDVVDFVRLFGEKGKGEDQGEWGRSGVMSTYDKEEEGKDSKDFFHSQGASLFSETLYCSGLSSNRISPAKGVSPAAAKILPTETNG